VLLRLDDVKGTQDLLMTEIRQLNAHQLQLEQGLHSLLENDRSARTALTNVIERLQQLQTESRQLFLLLQEAADGRTGLPRRCL